jgi:prepilin-type processing-associated H-X9-DG protein
LKPAYNMGIALRKSPEVSVRNAIQAMVLVSIFGLGLALAAIAIVNVRAAAERTQCNNNLKQTMLAIHNYEGHLGRLPRAHMAAPGLPLEKQLSWIFEILPYIEATNLCSRTDKTKSWDSDENRFVALMAMRTFQCPGFPERVPESTLAPTHYIGIAGIGVDAAFLPEGHPRAGFFGNERTLKISDIAGRTSDIFVMVETNQAHGSWIAAGPPTVRGVEDDMPYLGANRPWGGTHRRGTNVAMADGSVRFIDNAMDTVVFRAAAVLKSPEGVGPIDSD